MLIRKTILERIRSGEVTLAFRKWRRPTVKAGGTLKTAVGVLAIESVEKVSRRSVGDVDARKAGHSSKTGLLAELDARDGDLYRIALSYVGEDPRIALRERDRLTDEELDEILDRLRRFDAASRQGAWTHRVLAAIEENPRLLAETLAGRLGYTKKWLKANVRKLKEMGLTVSHRPGYTLSRRGEAALARLNGRR